jgi:arginase family enzyme
VDELMLALRVFSREMVVGYDVCEMTPDYDINGMGAQFCARTLIEILGGMAIRKRDAKAGLK